MKKKTVLAKARKCIPTGGFSKKNGNILYLKKGIYKIFKREQKIEDLTTLSKVMST